MSRWVGRGRSDGGSSSVWVLSFLLILATVAVVAVGGAGMLAQHARIAGAADLAALAAADAVQHGAGTADACRTAARVAIRNGARLARCQVAAEIVDVSVDAAATVLGVPRVSASARAGPVGGPA